MCLSLSLVRGGVATSVRRPGVGVAGIASYDREGDPAGVSQLGPGLYLNTVKAKHITQGVPTAMRNAHSLPRGLNNNVGNQQNTESLIKCMCRTVATPTSLRTDTAQSTHQRG